MILSHDRSVHQHGTWGLWLFKEPVGTVCFLRLLRIWKAQTVCVMYVLCAFEGRKVVKPLEDSLRVSDLQRLSTLSDSCFWLLIEDLLTKSPR